MPSALVVGCIVFFLPQMGPVGALRWGLYWGVRCIAGLSTLGAVITAPWLVVRPDGPRWHRGSGPMSPAG